MPVRVVLDACVLYPVALRDLLLRMAEAGLFQIVWSDRILKEMKDAILRNRPDIAPAKIDHMVTLMREAFPEAETSGWEALESTMANDERDRHVLALAVHSQANMIVTSNLKHFPRNSCEPYGLEPVDPDWFLCHMLQCDPFTVAAVLSVFSEDTCKPPLSVEAILDILERSVPRFAHMARPPLTPPSHRRSSAS